MQLWAPLLPGLTPPEGGGRRWVLQSPCGLFIVESSRAVHVPGTQRRQLLPRGQSSLYICALTRARYTLRLGVLEANSRTTECDGWISHLGLFNLWVPPPSLFSLLHCVVEGTGLFLFRSCLCLFLHILCDLFPVTLHLVTSPNGYLLSWLIHPCFNNSE